MNHRHLLPDEIDLLLGDEVGFGVAPLRAHLRDCADCRARLDEERVIVEALEGLPHLAPSVGFADRVMAEVPVFIPWHVAARDAVVSRIPQSRGARVAALALAGSVGSVFTVALLWVLTQGDLVSVAAAAFGDGVRNLVGDGARAAITVIFGEQVFAAIQQAGLVGLGLAVGAFVVSLFGAAFGLKAIAAAASRSRS